MFMKATSAITGPNDDVHHPARIEEDRLGSRARRRHRRPGELCLGRRRDEPCRGLLPDQRRVGAGIPDRTSGPVDQGQVGDTFGPIGPWLVTRDEIADPQNLKMWLTVNGVTAARWLDRDDDLRRPVSGSLPLPVHEPASRRHHLHRHAAGRRPRHKEPIFLHAGRRIKLGIEGLGEQRQEVVQG